MLRVDKRILAVSIARGMESFGVSLLIIALPIYIASDRIVLDLLINGDYGWLLTEELLIGVALSATALFSSIGQPFGGRVSDKLQVRKGFILIGLFSLGIIIPLYIIINSYYSLLLLRVVQGLTGVLIVPAAVALINEYAASNDVRGESFGVYNTVRLIGFGLGPIVGGIVIDLGPYTIFSQTVVGLDAAFIVSTIAVFFSLLLVIALVEETEKTMNTEQGLPLLQLLKTDDFKPVIVLGFATILMAASIAIFATLENVIVERLEQTTFLFGLQFSIAVLANTFVQTPIGRWSDKYGRKDFILLGFVLLIPAITIQGFVTGPYQMLFARLVQGISVAMVFAPSLALVGDMSGKENSGTYLSVLTASFGFGVAIGPVLSGLIFNFVGFAAPFVFSGILSVIALILVYLYVPNTQ